MCEHLIAPAKRSAIRCVVHALPHHVGIEQLRDKLWRQARRSAIQLLQHLFRGLHVLRHRLPPLLGEAFGGSTGLIDVGVAGYPNDLALRPLEHLQMPCLNAGIAAPRATVFPDRDRQQAVAEVDDLLDLVVVILQVAQ
jgi:hypothetical protein